MIAAAIQFVGEHLVEFGAAALVALVIWAAYVLTRPKRTPQDSGTTARTSGFAASAGKAPPEHRIPTRSVDAEACWIPQTGTARVRDRDVGGMVYCGTGLQAIGSRQSEPALIDPRLPIARGIDTYSERRLEYWPSYTTASESARAAYLRWLQEGRSDPSADIGYVFLYFYGLERRALHDARTHASAAQEIPAIEAEVTRILGIYGQNASFQRYASEFLDYLRVRRKPEQSYLSPPISAAHKGLTFCDRFALAQCAHDGAPLPVDWAYHWITHDTNTRLGITAQRCPDQFRQLFYEVYRDRYGKGLILPRNRTRLTFQYRAASASFRGSQEDLVFSPSLSDVTVLTGPVNKLAELASQVCEQLSSFSRLLGKDPSTATSFEALVHLPVTLWPGEYREQLESVRDIVARAGQPAAIPFAKFRSWIPEVAELTRPKLKALARALAGFGLAMEPDLRFGGVPPALDSRVVIFADDVASATEEASPRYQAAALALQLAAAVAMADGSAGEAERALLSEQARQWPALSESERRRLTALLRLLFLQGPKLTGLRKKIESLKPAIREAVGDFLIEIAQADNQVTPQEVKTLQKTFSLLGLDADRVYSKVHAAAVSATHGAANADGRSQRKGYVIRQPTKCRLSEGMDPGFLKIFPPGFPAAGDMFSVL